MGACSYFVFPDKKVACLARRGLAGSGRARQMPYKNLRQISSNKRTFLHNASMFLSLDKVSNHEINEPPVKKIEPY
jgi:hypothetical protein